MYDRRCSMIYVVNRIKLESKAGQRTAGKKAPDDIAEIAANRFDAELIAFNEPDAPKGKLSKKLGQLIVNRSNWKQLTETVKSGDTVILQHPYEGILGTCSRIRKMRRLGVRFVVLIHDLLSLRQNIESESSSYYNGLMSKEEIRILTESNAVICHNKKMKAYLCKCGIPESKIVCLRIFDYLADGEAPAAHKNDGVVTIAGNLAQSKSEYIYELINSDECSIRLYLYGPNFTGKNDDPQVQYKGQVLPDRLPSIMEGSFGLVWDGTSIDTCAGVSGEYLKFNNPHKCSLCLVSGMPVIVWKQAALAEFVEKNRLGLCVDSLKEIPERMARLSDEEYDSILKNVNAIREKLLKGSYFFAALQKALQLIEQ